MKSSMIDIKHIVDITVFCALREEYEALLNVKDGISEGGWIESKESGWSFADAEFISGNSTISFRATWLHEMGREQAQAVASMVLSKYPTRAVAMCGICAGRRGKVSLGDVIFATSMWSYDVGKFVVEDGKNVFNSKMFQYRLAPNLTQSVLAFKPIIGNWIQLRSTITLEQQEAWYLMNFGLADTKISNAKKIRNCPDWTEYVYDRLIKRGQIDKFGVLTTTGVEQGKILRARYPKLSVPEESFRVHTGPLATGASVVEDEGIFSRLSKSMRNVIGIDMESSALAALAEVHEVPIIVAKGVSDFGDTYKDDRFRTFAARASAECLVSFFRVHGFHYLKSPPKIDTVKTSLDSNSRSYTDFFSTFKNGYKR